MPAAPAETDPKPDKSIDSWNFRLPKFWQNIGQRLAKIRQIYHEIKPDFQPEIMKHVQSLQIVSTDDSRISRAVDCEMNCIDLDVRRRF